MAAAAVAKGEASSLLISRSLSLLSPSVLSLSPLFPLTIVLSSFSFLPAQFTEPNLIRLLNHPTPSSSHPGVTSIEPHRLNLPLRDSPHPPIYDNQPLLQATNAPQLQNKERKNKKQKKKTSEEIKSSFNLISFMSSDSTRSLTLNHSKDHLIILHPPPHQHQWPMLTRSHSIRSIRSLPI